jgi:hypothetical protein
MTASSFSTYLDLSKASTIKTWDAWVHHDSAAIEQAAKVLAAINGGAHRVEALREKTGLETDQILASLAGLSKAGLVELDEQEGILSAELTEPTKVALSSKS